MPRLEVTSSQDITACTIASTIVHLQGNRPAHLTRTPLSCRHGGRRSCRTMPERRKAGLDGATPVAGVGPLAVHARTDRQARVRRPGVALLSLQPLSDQYPAFGPHSSLTILTFDAA